jgi:hypothetical protein
MGLAMVTAFAVSTSILLTACGKKVTLPEPSATPKLTQVTTTATAELRITYGDSWYLLQMAEVCYDGIVYITTAKGGITPKLVDAGAPFTGTSATRVATCQ